MKAITICPTELFITSKPKKKTVNIHSHHNALSSPDQTFDSKAKKTHTYDWGFSRATEVSISDFETLETVIKVWSGLGSGPICWTDTLTRPTLFVSQNALRGTTTTQGTTSRGWRPWSPRPSARSSARASPGASSSPGRQPRRLATWSTPGGAGVPRLGTAAGRRDAEVGGGIGCI